MVHVLRNRLDLTIPFSSQIDINSRLFAVSPDDRFIYSGGHWDWSLGIYSLSKSKTISSFIYHTDIITCVALDSTGYTLVTGSRDTTCVIWNLSIDNEDESISVTSTKSLYGNQSTINCVAVSSELDLVASGSQDGISMIFTIDYGQCLRILEPTGDRYDPIVNLKLSTDRYILLQTQKDDTHLFLYSINGQLIRTRKFDYSIVDLVLTEQYIIVAVNQSSALDVREGFISDQTKPIEAARIIIKDLFE